MSTDFDLQDVLGWSCMHCAAAYGDPSDLAALIRLGGTTTLLTYRMEWTPAFIAVRFSNVSNLLELTEHLPPSFIEDRDTHGWTLLYNAADVGKEEIMRVLLGLGANPYVKSKETSFRVLSGLEDRALTSEDVVSNRCEDVYIAYV
jgi:ankyrin repeat protein